MARGSNPMRSQCIMPRRSSPIPDSPPGSFSSSFTTVWNNGIPQCRHIREVRYAPALLVYAVSPFLTESGHRDQDSLVGTHDGVE
jgi:hypothetical protein